MSASPEILIVFLSASAFLVALLLAVLLLLRLVKKSEPAPERFEMGTVMGAFNALGSEIQSLKDQLVIKERLAALGEISAGIAHEFRNPLGVIAGYAKLLLKELEADDKRREVVQAILNEVQELNGIMEELLKFSRSEPLNNERLNLQELVKDTIASMPEGKGNIHISPSSEVVIRGDATLLRQAIKNLLYNALEAGDHVVVAIEKEPSPADNIIAIAVQDNGKGIPEEELTKVFLPFYTTKRGGTGIGLALVQKIAMAHGGSVSVESREGKGSTFRLLLPAP
ncbi:MAG: sensor histidine kinase [Nitrospirota bacterium]